MNVAPITVDGWIFEITDSKLSITSEQNNNVHVQISAKAAFSLLDYLYHERDELSGAAQQETSEKVERKKSELREQDMLDNSISE
jgi:hypothetical protein